MREIFKTTLHLQISIMLNINKKGNSPLVVTILVMAVIIGVAGMIGGWVNQTFFTLENLCEDVRLDVSDACIDEGTVRFDLLNIATQDIQGYKIVMANGQLTESTRYVNITEDGISQESFNTEYTDNVSVEILPILTRNEDEQLCNSRRLEFELRQC